VFDQLAHIPADFWATFMEMAPYLLLGFVAAGVMSVLLPEPWVQKHLGGRRFSTVLKAAALGVPLPLCSCSVIPVSASLRRHGAGRGATVSFLISTPQTGVDSIAVTYGMLGGVFAVFRVVMALVSGIVGGAAVLWVGGKEEPVPQAPSATDEKGLSPLSSRKTGTVPGTPPHDARSKVRRAFAYAFVTLPEDIGKPIVLGLFIAALISALVPPNELGKLVPRGPGQIALLMLIGIPVYVCATASVPIAMALIHTGVSPGAAFAFLVTGAGTNAATVVTIWKLLGPRTTLIYLLTLAAASFGGGMLLDTIPGAAQMNMGNMTHEMGGNAWYVWPSTAILLVALATAFIRPPLLRRRMKAAALLAASAPSPAAPAPAITLAVSGMTCNHCRQTVRGALLAVPGVEEVEVDLASGRALVRAIDVDVELLRQAVRDAGYGTEETKA
jgi:uncharacterized membrane protein YraQ (UPF0718 family)/copper chaperone CopZ